MISLLLFFSFYMCSGDNNELKCHRVLGAPAAFSDPKTRLHL